MLTQANSHVILLSTTFCCYHLRFSNMDKNPFSLSTSQFLLEFWAEFFHISSRRAWWILICILYRWRQFIWEVIINGVVCIFSTFFGSLGRIENSISRQSNKHIYRTSHIGVGFSSVEKTFQPARYLNNFIQAFYPTFFKLWKLITCKTRDIRFFFG